MFFFKEEMANMSSTSNNKESANKLKTNRFKKPSTILDKELYVCGKGMEVLVTKINLQRNAYYLIVGHYFEIDKSSIGLFQSYSVSASN